ncbi:MAG: DNA internalization-related competence protein ComEC/Rec2 [candidate division KSB1 bacterium]|nr:DNA internalization-related competence protein ComEC/Rec2 [candidate division KSB1 bacterium]
MEENRPQEDVAGCPLRGSLVLRAGEWFFRRPAVLLFISLALGTLSHRLPLWVSLPSALMLVLLFLCSHSQGRQLWPELFLLLAVLLAASARTHARLSVLCSDPLFVLSRRGAEALLFGYVADEPQWFPDGHRQFCLRVERLFVPGDVLRTSRSRVLVLVSPDLGLPIHAGDRLVLRGQLLPIRPKRNPGDFDHRRYWLAEGVVAHLTVGSEIQIAPLPGKGGPWLVRSVTAPVQRWAATELYRRLPLREAGLLEALLLGRRAMIEPALREGFADLGVVHILAVSGLHVGYVAAGVMVLLSVFRVPWRVRWPLLLVALFLYSVLTGSKPPVVRAFLMASAVILAEAFQERYDLMNGLALAGCVILLRNPLALYQVGFLLSFGAVMGIGLAYPRIRAWAPPGWLKSPLTRGVWELTAVSLAAQFGTLPITLIYFGRLPLWGAVANVVVVPLTGVIVSLGFLTLLVTAFSSALGDLLASSCWKSLTILEGFVTLARQTGLGSLAVGHAPVPAVVAAWALSLAVLLSPSVLQRVRVGLFGSLALANLLVWEGAICPKPATDLLFLDVGVGDAALVRFPNGKVLVVDAGDVSPAFDSGKEVVIPVLRRLGVRKVDVVVATHAHQDHVGGLASVLRTIPVRRIVWSGYQSDMPAWRQVVSVADSLQIPLVRRCAGDTIGGFEPAVVAVLGPDCRNQPTNPNDASLVLLLHCQGKRILLAGDIEEEGERAVLRYAPVLRCSVLKVAHHGSPRSSGEGFLQATQPEIGIISASQFNRFGFPSAAVVERLQGRGCEVLQTGKEGAVWLRLRGGTLTRVRW